MAILSPGSTVERYVVEAVLGKGGMAVVYRVRHRVFGTVHALKLLRPGTPGLVERLLREGRVQAQLRHPNLVAVSDVLEVDGLVGLLMEYVDGRPLSQHLQEGPIPTYEEIFRGIVAGVMAAHDEGVVHRDLKPANIILTRDGFVPKVSDFGMLKLLYPEEDEPSFTRSGLPLGTPPYMAPEQIRDARGVDARADMFSLGCILYELLSGRQAFDGPDVLAVYNAVATGERVPIEELVPALPDRLRMAVDGCLVVDRDARIPDTRTLLAVLDGALTWSAPPAPRRPAATGSLTARTLEGGVWAGRIDTLPPQPVVTPTTTVPQPTPTPPRPPLQAPPRWTHLGWLAALALAVPTRPIIPLEVPPQLSPPPALTLTFPAPAAPPAPVVATPAVPAVPTAVAPAARRAPAPVEAAPVELVRLQINSTPWSTVRIDGVSAGHTPVTQTLPSGTHTIELQAEDGRRRTQTMTIEADRFWCWDFDVERTCLLP